MFYRLIDEAKILKSAEGESSQDRPLAYHSWRQTAAMKAHEAAALSGLGMEFLQDMIFTEMRSALGARGAVLDEFQLEDSDPAKARYR